MMIHLLKHSYFQFGIWGVKLLEDTGGQDSQLCHLERSFLCLTQERAARAAAQTAAQVGTVIRVEMLVPTEPCWYKINGLV